MGRRRYTEEQFRDAVADPTVTTIAELCRRLGIVPRGGNYASMRAFAQQLDLDLDGVLASRPKRIRPGRWLAPWSAETRCTSTRDQELDVIRPPASGDAEPGGGRQRRPLSEILQPDTQVNTSRLRKRLVEEGLLPPECASCGRSWWQGEQIPLELDHVDGDRTNNLLENLRLLCPNCHALTPTYRGRNIGRRPNA